MIKRLWMLLILTGCGTSTEIVSPDIQSRASELSALLTSTKVVETKQDTILTAIEANTVAISEVKTKVESLEASLIVPKSALGKEVIKSALESPPATNAKDSHPTKGIVAEPVGTRLTSDGTRLQWNIAGNWNPTILETSAHLAREHGINTNGMSHQQMADLHASLHDGKQVAMKSRPVQLINRGTSCPGGVCPTNTRQRKGLFGWRR